MSDARRAEVRDLFAWLDRAQRGALGVDELAFWTRALAADEEVPQGCVAPAGMVWVREWSGGERMFDGVGEGSRVGV